MTSRGFAIHALSEFAIRTANMAEMVAFYRDIIGLELFATRPDRGIVFFKVSDGHAGLTAVLALFDVGSRAAVASGRGDGDRPASSLHHLALAVSRAEQDAAEAWFRENGVATRTEEFGWVGWRGLFVNDPDGNTVELVASDPSLYNSHT